MPEWLRGIDVSWAQGARDLPHDSLIDWPTIRPHIDVVIVKASEGATINDRTAASHLDGIRSVGGLTVGLYHFARTASSPQDNANRFLARWSAFGGADFPALDFEDSTIRLSPAEATQWALDCLEAIEAGTGKLPIFYTYTGYASRFDPDVRLARYPLWLANYGANDGSNPPARNWPAVPAPWSSYIGWQHTSVGRLPGYGSNLDLNLFDPTFIQQQGDTVTIDELVSVLRSEGISNVAGKVTEVLRAPEFALSHVRETVDAIASRPAAGGSVDVDAIAEAVANKLAKRLAS